MYLQWKYTPGTKIKFNLISSAYVSLSLVLLTVEKMNVHKKIELNSFSIRVMYLQCK